MSYERHCEEYALYGDPERDAMDYDLAAEYDRYDGLRGDAMYDGFDPGEDSDKTGGWDWVDALGAEGLAEENWVRAWIDLAWPVPF